MQAYVQPNPGDRAGSVLITGSEPLMKYLPAYAVPAPNGRGLIVPLACLADAQATLTRAGFDVVQTHSTPAPPRRQRTHRELYGMDEDECRRCNPRLRHAD